jgi:hypothetical protein
MVRGNNYVLAVADSSKVGRRSFGVGAGDPRSSTPRSNRVASRRVARRAKRTVGKSHNERSGHR